MDLINALAADHQRIHDLLNEISDEPSGLRKDKLSELRILLMQHREIEELCLYRVVELVSTNGRMLAANARVRDTEGVDLLETLYDFGVSMDSVLWIEIFADLQSLLEDNMEFKRKEIYQFALRHKITMDKAS